MSTVSDPQKAQPALPLEEIYRYGWRDVPTKQPDGSTDFIQVPLTLEDVLHPQMGDHVVENMRHDRAEVYLALVCRARAYRDPSALVSRDLGIYWDDPALGHHSPDVAVIFNVRDRDRPRPSFFVATEGTRPRLIIEVTSPHNRQNDVVTKFEEYHRLRILRYVIVDQLSEDTPLQIRGYQHAPDGYHELPKDEHGRLWLEDVGVWLGTDGERVYCYDPHSNEPIPDYVEMTHILGEIRQQAEAEKARAEAEKERADVEKARAEAEIQARQALEQRLRDLEAELARRSGQNPS
jgi:Uma2 family endonuclease